MLMGFRAGDDPAIHIRSDDFTSYRKALQLPAGTAPIGRVFPNGAVFGTDITGSQLIAKAEAACAPVLDADMWPYLSLKPQVAETLDGRLDEHLTRLAKWIAGLGQPFYFSVWHEPENNTMGADFHNHLSRAQNFVDVHKRAYRLMKDIAGDALRMGPCHMAYQWRLSSETTRDGLAQAWRVPDDHADFYAVDSYTSNWSWPAGRTLKEKTDFQRWLTQLAPTTSKILLAERGITINYPKATDGVAGQATLLAQDYDYLTKLGALGLIYWNSGGASDGSVYLLGDLGRTVFRDLAIAAARIYTPPSAEDRYQEGYDVGHRTGLTKGVTAGRYAAFQEVSAWAQGHAGPV